MTDHGGGVIEIRRLGAFSSFLWQEGDGWTAIDTGLPGSAPAILAAAARMPIRRIALTHGHLDHAGAADALARAAPGAEMAMSAIEARGMAGDWGAGIKPKGSFRRLATPVSRTLEPGDFVGELEVVATPGHTPGHIGFWHAASGTFFAGDALSAVGGLTVSGAMNWRFPFPALATWDKAAARASARAIAARKPRRLVMAHGGVLDAPGAALAAALGA